MLFKALFDSFLPSPLEFKREYNIKLLELATGDYGTKRERELDWDLQNSSNVP